MINYIVEYKRIDTYQVSKKLADYLDQPSLTSGIEEYLSQYIILDDFEKAESSLLQRITAPFYFLTTILLILFWLPILWIFTGKFKYTKQTKLSNFMVRWSKYFN